MRILNDITEHVLITTSGDALYLNDKITAHKKIETKRAKRCL
jgi:hypothetical protein